MVRRIETISQQWSIQIFRKSGNCHLLLLIAVAIYTNEIKEHCSGEENKWEDRKTINFHNLIIAINYAMAVSLLCICWKKANIHEWLVEVALKIRIDFDKSVTLFLKEISIHAKHKLSKIAVYLRLFCFCPHNTEIRLKSIHKLLFPTKSTLTAPISLEWNNYRKALKYTPSKSEPTKKDCPYS